VRASTRLELRVVPRAAQPGISGRYGTGWKIRVAAPPESGRANAAVCSLLAEAAGLAPRDVSIVSGRAARDKVVALSGIAAAELERRLTAATGAPA
jgi:uncharacterized protein